MAKKRETGLTFHGKMSMEDVLKKMLNSPPHPSSKKGKKKKVNGKKSAS
jgi:hypothetical protein